MEIIPELNITYKKPFPYWRFPQVNLVVIRFADLICRKSGNFNYRYRSIVRAGGLKAYLPECGAKMILSFVIPDHLISKLSVSNYVQAINELRPDYYTTLDAETYHNEHRIGEAEIKRLCIENKLLVESSTVGIPLGLIKGSNKTQINNSILSLKALGINKFTFHSADFLRTNHNAMRGVLREHIHFIKQRVSYLLLHGFCGVKSFGEFAYCDGYITNTHFIRAYYGNKIISSSMVKYTGGFSIRIVRDNFVELLRLSARQNTQTKLLMEGVEIWAAALDQTDQTIQKV